MTHHESEPSADLPLERRPFQLGLLGSEAELETHFDRHSVPPSTRDLIRDIVRGDPLRRVGGGARNAVVRYASRKMGVVVQAESRTVEGALVQSSEPDPEVLLYLCQPLKLSVPVRYTYTSVKTGASHTRTQSIHTVVDFFVVRPDGFFLVECKSSAELDRDSKRTHPRFVRDGDRWRWPAAEKAAREIGLGFILFTSEDVNPIFLRNMRARSIAASAPSPRGAFGSSSPRCAPSAAYGSCSRPPPGPASPVMCAANAVRGTVHHNRCSSASNADTPTMPKPTAPKTTATMAEAELGSASSKRMCASTRRPSPGGHGCPLLLLEGSPEQTRVRTTTTAVRDHASRKAGLRPRPTQS